MDDLKTCPFCGGKASLRALDEGNGIHYVVVCETVGCRASEDYAWPFQDDKIKAISAWNKRATIHCKDCKHWKDSDGVYRRGLDAESKCPINMKEVYEGTFFCGMAKKDEREKILN